MPVQLYQNRPPIDHDTFVDPFQFVPIVQVVHGFRNTNYYLLDE